MAPITRQLAGYGVLGILLGFVLSLASVGLSFAWDWLPRLVSGVGLLFTLAGVLAIYVAKLCHPDD